MNRRLTLALAALLVAASLAGCAGLAGTEETPDERPNETYLDAADGNVSLEAAVGQEITGHVNESRTVEDVTVRLRSADSENPFLRTKTATVSGDGTFETTVNLSNVAPGTSFEVVVLDNDTTLVESTGEVVNDS